MPPARLFPARGFAAPDGHTDGPKSLLAPAEAKSFATFEPVTGFWLEGNTYRSDLPPGDAIHHGTAMRASALVYRCIEFRARKMSEAPLWLADEKNGDESWLPSGADHPLAPLLERPNPDQAAAAFLGTLSIAMDMGPALVVKNRDNAGRVASLYIFAWDQFTVWPDLVDGTPRMFGKFRVTGLDGRQSVFGPDDVLFFPPLGGVAPLDAALSHVRISETMRQAVKTALVRTARPGSVLTIPGVADESALVRLRGSLEALYSGPANTGRPAVFEQDAKFQQLSTSLRDMELGPVQGDGEAAICQAFGIHPALVGAKIALENSSGLSDSLKPALSLFYDLVLFPRWGEIEGAFTAGLLRPVDATPTRFVRFDKSKIRALAPDKTANVVIARNATGIMTINEQRALLQLDPRPDGDVLSTSVMPAASPASISPSRDPQGSPIKSAPPGARETKAARPTTPAEAAAFWQAFEAKAAPAVGRYEAAARGRFREERAGVLATLRAAVPKAARVDWERKGERKADSKTPPDGESDAARRRREFELAALLAFQLPYLEAAELQIAADYAADGPYAQAWAQEFGDLLTVTMEGAAKEFTAGLSVTFSMDDPRLLAAIQARAAALVQHVTDTTKATITDAIATAKAEGLTIEQVAQRVDAQAFGATAAARAQAIANTEVVGAINDAHWTAATATDVFQSKRWIHTRRPGQRDYHEAHETEKYDGHDAGGWVPMTYEYTEPDGRKGLRPFDPRFSASSVVHCGCVLAFSDVGPAQALEES